MNSDLHCLLHELNFSFLSFLIIAFLCAFTMLIQFPVVTFSFACFINRSTYPKQFGKNIFFVIINNPLDIHSFMFISVSEEIIFIVAV